MKWKNITLSRVGNQSEYVNLGNRNLEFIKKKINRL